MPTIDVLWRECPRQKIKHIRGYQPPEPYDTQIEIDFPNLFSGEDAAEAVVQANVENDPESWNAFDYTIEILSPDNLAGRFQVEIVMEPACEAHRLEEAA